MLEAEPPLGPGDVESLLLDLMPERNREALRSGAGTEWICDVPDVGRVRCMTFRDQRGPGGIFRMMPARAISADQLGLSREIQALAAEPEGLVLVAGPRSSGKSTLMSAFVDLINRTRRDHVITIESEIKVVHERRQLARQPARGARQQRGDARRRRAPRCARIPTCSSSRSCGRADLVTVALDAAGSGHLVIGALPAHTATVAIDRIIDLYPPEYRRHVQFALAENLRGVVVAGAAAQDGRRPRGGARGAAEHGGRGEPRLRKGRPRSCRSRSRRAASTGWCRSTTRSSASCRAGVVEAREAYRRAADRAGLLALLERQGIDTSVLERMA